MSAVSAIPLALALTAFLGVSLGVRVPDWLLCKLMDFTDWRKRREHAKRNDEEPK